jgi:hypothetical protein
VRAAARRTDAPIVVFYRWIRPTQQMGVPGVASLA